MKKMFCIATNDSRFYFTSFGSQLVVNKTSKLYFGIFFEKTTHDGFKDELSKSVLIGL